MMGFGWGMGYGWIIMLVFWVLLVGLVVWAVSRLAPRSMSGSGRRETTLEVLQRRLANGEISVEEFVRIRDELAQGSTSTGGRR
jgi:putative membrane protein